MSYTIHSTKSLYKLMSTYWKKGIFRTLSKIWDRALWKVIIAFNYFCAALYLKSLRRFWMCARFWLFQSSEYSKNDKMPNFQGYKGLTWFYKYVRVLNIPELSVCPKFWISRVTQGLLIFVNMTGFMQKLWKLLNMPEFGWIMPE